MKRKDENKQDPADKKNKNKKAFYLSYQAAIFSPPSPHLPTLLPRLYNRETWCKLCQLFNLLSKCALNSKREHMQGHWTQHARFLCVGSSEGLNVLEGSPSFRGSEACFLTGMFIRRREQAVSQHFDVHPSWLAICTIYKAQICIVYGPALPCQRVGVFGFFFFLFFLSKIHLNKYVKRVHICKAVYTTHWYRVLLIWCNLAHQMQLLSNSGELSHVSRR